MDTAMMHHKPLRPRLTVGAVAYDPKVVTIWDGFERLLAATGVDVSYVLFSSYERQVEEHLAGHIDLAWNSPLAFIETVRACAQLGRGQPRAVAMRDSDQDVSSVIVVRADRGLTRIEDLRGRTVAVGSADSPQATLLPLDTVGGKHGDVLTGERQAVRALLAGEADAACAFDASPGLFVREGTCAPGTLRVLTKTAAYDHCNLTALDTGRAAIIEAVVGGLLAMSYEDPAARPLMDLEGLKQWRPGRETGYAALGRAVDRFGVLDHWLPTVARSA
jgi:phosphonate transport system substrate-binding protein